MKIKILSIAVVTALGLTFSGCGSSSSDDDSSTTNEPAISTGIFVDAPVNGLSYKTATQNGYTNDKGEYKYISGETVEFKLGNISLGTTTATSTVTPYTISDNNTTATNIAMLLQNFDSNRSDTTTLNLTNLKDYNFSNINLNSTNTEVESQLNTLLATGQFQDYVDDNNLTLVDSTHATNTMNNYLDIDTITLTQTVETITTKDDLFTSDIISDGKEYYVIFSNDSTVSYIRVPLKTTNKAV